MIDYLVTLVNAAATLAEGRNVTREYLQARILEGLQRAGAFVPLAFHGGAALRFLYSIPRYSEDLDFALERERERYDFRTFLETVQRDLQAEGYVVTVRISDRRTVHSAFVRFPGLLYEINLSPHRSEALAIKLEVDTHPPAGAELATTVIRRHVVLHLQHHNPASLLAGKVHAILQRPYLKGRDLYDLLWYLSDPHWPTPNLVLLNHALQQTGWSGESLTSDTWRSAVRARLETVDWEQARDDVRPFLEPGADESLLTTTTILGLLAKVR